MRLKKVDIGYKKTLFHIEELQLHSGNIYVLIGANGGGKSTLMKTLMGTVQPIAGSILLDQKPISSLSLEDRSKRISLVQSKFNGVPFMRAEEFVALGRTPHTNRLGRMTEKDWALVEESFRVLQIDYLKGKFTLEMSDGERQLLAIARAYAQQTDYILLDEPTAFLDYANKRKVLQIVGKLAKEENKTILISSHDMELSMQQANAVLLIEKSGKRLVYKSREEIDLEEIIHTCFD